MSNPRGVLFKTLTGDQAVMLVRRFVPAAEAIYGYAERLRLANFRAFDPYLKMLDSFADSEATRDVHWRCVVELAKLTLGQPWPPPRAGSESAGRYQSEFIERLRAERDRSNGVPVQELSRCYSAGEVIWRSQIDPVKRAMARFRVEQPREYNELWTTTLGEQERQIKLETEIHSKIAADSAIDFQTPSDRFCFLSEIMEREIRSLGFLRDDRKPRASYPLFIKEFNSDFDLGWTIEDSTQFFSGPSEGYFEPCLQIRSKSLPGRLDKAKAGEFILIRYHHILPGFGSAYWKYYGPQQLELMIKAHLYFYTLMQPIIESTTKRQ